jgi:tRNA (cytidine/uridine-2'-O-)-methyltransferase
MFHVVLFQPEIPPNTGNAIRLCANTGATLHLVRPLGFDVDDARLRRAGLDYREFATLRVHDDLDACVAAIGAEADRAGALAPRWWVVETGEATRFDRVAYREGDAFLFGRETSGLPADVLARFDVASRIALPMREGNRSLNLSNAVAVTVFEAWRQCGYAGSQGTSHE